MNNNNGSATTHRDAKGRWLPGYTGNINNVGGRPPEALSLVNKLRAYLQDHPEDAQAIINNIVHLGKTRLDAAREILDRIDGKPTERHVVEGQLPIRIVFVPAPALKEATSEQAPPLLLGPKGRL